MNIEKPLFKKPKGDLHNHISLGMRYSSFRKWTGKALPDLPRSYKGLPDMTKCIDSLYKPFVRSASDAFDLIEMAIEESIRDNVVLLEGSIDIGIIKFFDNIDLFLQRVDETTRKFKTRIDFRPDLGISKVLSAKVALNWGKACIDSQLFNGIDFYGPEIKEDFSEFKKLYILAGEKNMIKKAHIGEFSDAESIKKMIESFELDEVQHGITAVNSEEVIDYLIKNKIQLNICPFSNISLGAIDNIKNHPIRHLFDSGVKLTINTDDLLFFDKSNSEQYYELIKNKMFTEKEIDRIRLNSLRLEE